MKRSVQWACQGLLALALGGGLAACGAGGGPGALRDPGATAAGDGDSLVARAVGARWTQEIAALERRRFEAMVAADGALLEPMLSERLRYCHSNGRCETKGEFLAGLAGGALRYRAIEVLELEPRLVGTAMLVQGRLQLSVEQQGEAQQLQVAFTDVCESPTAGWQLVAWQSTRLP